MVLAGAGLSTLSSCGDTSKIEGPAIQTKKKYEWKMVTTWPASFPVLAEGCQRFSQLVDQMSNGQLKIKVYGAGELIPAYEVFEAVSGGAAEMGSGASYYWAGRNPATQIFTTVPFGMNAQQMNAWLYHDRGLELWQSLYADFGVIPFPGGNTGVQMAGWFNRKIEKFSDFKGLKMRIPGLGGQILEKSGATPVLLPPGEIYTNLERGVIDAAEWIGPYHDYLMGLHQISK